MIRAVFVITILLAAGALAGCSKSDSEQSYITERNITTVQNWYAARRAKNTALASSFLSDSSRIWFEDKSGSGKIRDASGEGPWAGWDEYFESTSRFDDWQADADSVWVTVHETNKFYRLLERVPAPYRATYYLDEQGRIEGTLIAAIPGAVGEPGRVAEFETWLEQTFPGELEQLKPDGRIDPSLENAQLWHRRINEWRQSVGLEPIE